MCLFHFYPPGNHKFVFYIYDDFYNQKTSLRAPNHKTPRINSGEKILDSDLCIDFLDVITKVTRNKSKVSGANYIKLNNLCTAKEVINKMERQPKVWEKYLQIIYPIRD